MIKVAVQNSTGAVSARGEMNDFGIIFYQSGEVSSVTAEASKGKSIVVIPEAVAAPESSEPRSEAPKKRGRRAQ